MPTASQSCRHPGAISEIADLTHSLSVSRSLCSVTAHFSVGFFKVRPEEVCLLFVAKPNKDNSDNINAAFSM